jgi:hypothetical protein
MARSTNMQESEFWGHLEYRLGREFEGMTEQALHRYWCDGIYGESYFINERRPRILGHAWICQGGHQEEWKFELLLPHRVKSRDQIDWAALLPPANVTRWLAVNVDGKFIQIEPAVAVPDLSK